jgi:PKD repeat protein
MSTLPSNALIFRKKFLNSMIALAEGRMRKQKQKNTLGRAIRTKNYLVLFILPLLISLLGSQTAFAQFGVAGDDAPPLPSSFYGEIHISDSPPAAGALVEGYMPGAAGPAVTTAIVNSGGLLVYSVNVPAGDKGTAAEGDAITFKIGGRIVAKAAWHSGTNVALNFHPPQAIPNGPYAGYEDSSIGFNGAAGDWGADGDIYQWDWDLDGTYDAAGQSTSHTWADPGTYTIGFRVTDAQGGEGVQTTTVTVVENGSVPPLPSSFYGEIHIFDNPPAAGDRLEAYLPGASTPDSTAIVNDAGTLVYALNVPAGAAGLATEGETITFKINGRVVATATWHTGTNVPLHIHPPQALTGGTYSAYINTAISFSASANDWGGDAVAYQWDWDNDGAYDETGQSPSHTWATPGSYPVGLKVIDVLGGEGFATTTVTINAYLTTSVNLYPGWNLVSFNLHPLDTATASVLADISGKFNLVYAWDASGGHPGAGNWLKFDPTAPTFVNTLNNIDEKMGFWIYMTAADTLDVTGTAPGNSSIPLYTTVGGWNLVGYPAAVAGTLPNILRDHGVGNDYTVVYAYHVADTADPWKLFDPTFPFSDLTSLTSGWGYWIYVTANQTWIVTY